MTEEKNLAEKFLKDLEGVKAKKGAALGFTDIKLLVESLTPKKDKSLYEKVLAIAVKIHHLKDDFAAIDSESLAGDYLPNAGDRLHAVVEATEKATHAILDSVTEIQGEVGKVNAEIAKKIEPHVTKIFEACNFQDITGQHINKVVAVLDDVELLVKAIIKVLPEDFKKSVKDRTFSVKDFEKSLMNGPGLASAVPTQDDIDRLFAES